MGKPQNGNEVRLAVVGTVSFMEPTVNVCRQAGFYAKAFPLRRYVQAFRWLLSRDFRQSTMIYQWGAPGVKYIVAAKIFGKPVIKHWIGDEAHDLVDGRGFVRNVKLWIYKHWPAFHLSVNKALAARLESVGIKVAGMVRTITETLSSGQVEPLPEEFTVLGYWTPGAERRQFYGGDMILQLARENPDIRFLIVGNDGQGESAPPNVEFLGYLKDLAEVYSRCSVLVRMPKTDGAANMPLEMVVRGRYVIYNIPMEGCHLAKDIDEVRSALADIRNLPCPNVEGARIVKEKHTVAKEAAIFRQCLLDWLADHKGSRSKRQQHVS